MKGEDFMCSGGIPIGPVIIEGFPRETKRAFYIFQKWWSIQEVPRRNNMPLEVKQALETIENTEIPGHNGVTCKSSCSIMCVEREFNKNQ
ncbi:MAG: hypothetical protein WCT51_04690 [Candidatus Shapirobacteria bacterium]